MFEVLKESRIEFLMIGDDQEEVIREASRKLGQKLAQDAAHQVKELPGGEGCPAWAWRSLESTGHLWCVEAWSFGGGFWGVELH